LPRIKKGAKVDILWWVVNEIFTLFLWLWLDETGREIAIPLWIALLTVMFIAMIKLWSYDDKDKERL
jgi:hypothetical protein